MLQFVCQRFCGISLKCCGWRTYLTTMFDQLQRHSRPSACHTPSNSTLKHVPMYNYECLRNMQITGLKSTVLLADLFCLTFAFVETTMSCSVMFTHFGGKFNERVNGKLLAHCYHCCCFCAVKQLVFIDLFLVTLFRYI